ncbi:MAG: hypothetical protein HRT68_12175 [Flavobacteriaceae bacterium]|nr:hypothetical protein [Flavobacteriaceae bacterium]
MLDKIYKTTYWVFLIASVLILIGINQGYISYGVDVQTPFMAIGIFAVLLLITIFRILLRKLNTDTKKTLALALTIVMAFLCFYYLLEDQFLMKL